MESNIEEGVKYPKERFAEIAEWWQSHREYDVNQYQDYIEVVRRPNWEKERIERLRAERERVCFPVINRGELWYARLTEEQKSELDAWYQAWLNVTETWKIPETPSWV